MTKQTIHLTNQDKQFVLAQVDQAKLVTLKALAAEGFRQIAKGQGVALEGAKPLKDFISRIGRRSAEPMPSATLRTAVRASNLNPDEE